MLDQHREIFDACSADPPLLHSVKTAYEKLKIRKVIDCNTGNTPLHLALVHGADLEVVEYLVSTDKDMVRSANIKMLLPIHLACNGKNSSLNIVTFLVEQWKGCLQMGTGLGNTPLHVACVSRAPLPVVRYLLRQYERARNTENRRGQTPVDCAMAEDRKPAMTDVVEMLGGNMILVEESRLQMITADAQNSKTKPNKKTTTGGTRNKSRSVSSKSNAKKSTQQQQKKKNITSLSASGDGRDDSISKTKDAASSSLGAESSLKEHTLKEDDQKHSDAKRKTTASAAAATTTCASTAKKADAPLNKGHRKTRSGTTKSFRNMVTNAVARRAIPKTVQTQPFDFDDSNNSSISMSISSSHFFDYSECFNSNSNPSSRRS